MADTDDRVELTDLDVISRYSLAVRAATVDRHELIATLRADLDWLEGARRRRASSPAVAPTEPVTAVEPEPQSPATTQRPSRPDLRAPAAKRATAKKATAKPTTARPATPKKVPASKAPARKAPASKVTASKLTAKRTPARKAAATRNTTPSRSAPARKTASKKATAKKATRRR